MLETSSGDGLKIATNTLPLSQSRKMSIDENLTTLNVDVKDEINLSTNVEHNQHPAKTEKGNSEEGFCCVMSMHDGVVL